MTQYWGQLFLAPYITASRSSTSSKPTPFLQAMGSPSLLVQFGLGWLKTMQFANLKGISEVQQRCFSAGAYPMGCTLLPADGNLSSAHRAYRNWLLPEVLLLLTAVLHFLWFHLLCPTHRHTQTVFSCSTGIFCTSISRQGNCSALVCNPSCPFAKWTYIPHAFPAVPCSGLHSGYLNVGLSSL